MSTALLLTEKRIVFARDTRDYDAFLGEHYIGSFPTAMQAQVELDRLACDQAADGVADPRDAFALGALPTTLDVTDTAMQSAYVRLTAAFACSPKVQERAERALAISLARAETMQIVSANEVTVRGSGTKPYRVQMEPLGTTCTCRDFHVANRHAVHGGMCKHIIAVELVRMAAADASFADAEAEATAAEITLDAYLFTHACAIAQHAAQAVTLAIVGDTLRIAVGNDGLCAGIALTGRATRDATLTVDAADFAALWQHVKTVAAQLQHVSVLLDATSVIVTDEAASFAAGAAGMTITT